MTFRQFLSGLAPAALFGATIAVSFPAQASSTLRLAALDGVMEVAIRREAGGKLGKFYESRNYRPLWIEKGLIGRDAQTFLRYLDEADVDGLSDARYKPDKLRQAIAVSDRGDPRDLARAEIALTKAFTRYVQDMRRPVDTSMEFADASLQPQKMDEIAILRVASMKDFSRYMQNMGWMNPQYARVRNMMLTATANDEDPRVTDMLRVNLERARVLPSAAVRHIVVDAASARLWYYQDGEQVGTMKVVVGSAKTQTPMLAGYVNWAIVNPYWNIPDYLTRENVARKVLSGRTLESMHMQVLSDWSADPQVIDPSTIDWQAVADGRLDLRIRELPGPANSMGKVKFLFPNDKGIYLHDTPNRDLFARTNRHVSNGCIRLENAAELGKWMMGKPLDLKSKGVEQAVPLPVPVPVYLTYLTATHTKKGIAFLDDVYGRDEPDIGG